MFDGISVALVTPFRGGSVDEPALRRLIHFVLEQGVHGLVLTGSTGETPTLSPQERDRIWAIGREEVRKPAFLIAGTGTNSTPETIRLTGAAAGRGVDGCMVVTPYYNKPQQRGLAAHFRAVADASPVPLLLYNVPSRTGVNLLPETVEEVSSHPRIVALKEASGSVDQATEILRRSPITLLSGEDSLTLPLLAVGAKGIVSVAGHLVGKEMREMLDAFRAGRTEEAAAIHRRLFGIIRGLFLETNPAPLKSALARLGLCENELRPPLVPVGKETAAVLLREMDALGLVAKAG